MIKYTLRCARALFLHLAFAHWAAQSTYEYWSEPAITNIYYRYTNDSKPITTYKDMKMDFGKDSGDSAFPLITFCELEPEYIGILKEECGLNTTDSVKNQLYHTSGSTYVGLISQCIENNQGINLTKLSNKIIYSR